MKVGIIGLGKLGMPVALGMNLKGHDVMGYGKLSSYFVFKYKLIFYKIKYRSQSRMLSKAKFLSS
jgi:UDP-N-acetyl-D-mannosaminuronate dehydrogenase